MDVDVADVGVGVDACEYEWWVVGVSVCGCECVDTGVCECVYQCMGVYLCVGEGVWM